MQKIFPFLWFESEAENAVNHYVSIFKNSRIGKIARYGDKAAELSGRSKGSVMTIEFQLEGQDFVALNGGPAFKFTPAISLFVNCTSQDEVDALWNELSDGGQIMQCGWVTDKFGVTWQICPIGLTEMLNDPDSAKAKRTMNAMLQMKKLDINVLRRAYEGVLE